MIRVRPVAFAVVLASLAALPGIANAQLVMKHSGSIVAMDRDAGTLTVAEVGPWRTEGGTTVVNLLTVTVAPETRLTLVYRTPEAPSGFPGDWIEETLEPWNLFQGDYVTVDCLHQGTRLLARHVTVLETEIP